MATITFPNTVSVSPSPSPSPTPSIPLSALKDRKLVTLSQQKDSAAFGELYKRHYPSIKRICMWRMRDADLAEECTSDVFVSALRHIDSFQQKSAFSTWLTRIAINVCIMKVRKLKRQRESSAGLPGQDDLLFPLHQELTHEQISGDFLLIEKMHAAIDRLTPNNRECIMLAMTGYSGEEMAKIVGIPLTTVKARLNHARERLRKELASLEHHK